MGASPAGGAQMIPNESRYRPLDQESRAAIPTAEAAFHLGRRPQTLRSWACLEDGPLRPIRVHGKLLWPVAELRRLVGLAGDQR